MKKGRINEEKKKKTMKQRYEANKIEMTNEEKKKNTIK